MCVYTYFLMLLFQINLPANPQHVQGLRTLTDRGQTWMSKFDGRHILWSMPPTLRQNTTEVQSPGHIQALAETVPLKT